MRPERRLRHAVVAAVLGLGGWAVCAPVTADDAALAVQLQTDAIKQKALQLGLQATELQDRRLDRMAPATTVYLSVGNSGAAILAAAVVVDGAAPAFSGPLAAEETQALQQGGSLRLARLGLTPGSHRIHAEVLLKFAGDSEARSLAVDQDCDIAAAPSDIVLAPEGNSWLSSPRLALHRQSAGPAEPPGLLDMGRLWSVVNGPEVKDGAYRPGSNDDPRVGYARFLIATHDYFRAAVWLERLSDGLAPAALPADYYEVLTDALIDCDALAPAQAAYRQALASHAAATDAATLRTRIAEAYYQRQDYAAAEQALGLPPQRRDKQQFTAWQDLRSRVLLAQGRYDQAGDALKAADAGADFDSYVRYYNFGVTLIQNGMGPQGATVLDRVGTVPGNSHDMISLSDSANLALGSWLLRNGQGATAIPVLERIELAGRFSDRALLDLGWAWLAPAGEKQQRIMLGDERTQGPPPETVGALHQPFDTQNIYQRYHLRPFVQATLDRDPEARTRRALATWSELIGRDSSSDAVQEAFLAAGLALDHLGAHQEAAELYNRGVKAMEMASHAVDDSASYVRSDQWVGDLLATSTDKPATRFDLALRNLPRPGVAVRLDGYIAGWSFQHGLQQYRGLDAVDANLAVSAAALDTDPATAPEDAAADQDQIAALRQDIAALRSDIATARSGEVAVLRQQLLDQLALQQRRLLKLLEGARFEVARIYDGVPQ